MKELNTIQTKAKLNKVFRVGVSTNGGVYQTYKIEQKTNDGTPFNTYIHFQNGPRFEPDSISGILDCDLLEIVRDRLTSFQNGLYPSEYTARALHHIEEALYQMNLRVEERLSRGIMGKLEK